jgi:hypothetical protein
MEEPMSSSNFLSSHFFVSNDSLYAPLTASDHEVVGIGVHLALVHDPPMYDNAAQSGVTYKYINRVNSIEVNSPAERAGMCTGDIIIAVDNVNIDDGQRLYLPDDVAELIHGKEGSRVVVVIEREGRKIEYTIIRAPIVPASDTRSLPTSPLPSIRDTTESFKRLVSPELDRALDIIDDKVGIDLRRMF